MAKTRITVQGIEVRLETTKQGEFICLTDIGQIVDLRTGVLIQNWLRGRSTIEFLGHWELLNNRNFKVIEFDDFKNRSGSNSFVIGVKEWIDKTEAVGLISASGRYGGTYAHFDIAVHFCNWLSSEFYVHFVKQFRTFNEAARLGDKWDLRRELAKANYAIHTDAVRQNLVPEMEWNTRRERIYFASEADLLNVAMFGMTAKQWKAANSEKKGNIRDAATVEELQVLANMESLNAALIEQGFNQDERLVILARRAEREVEILKETKAVQNVKKIETKE